MMTNWPSLDVLPLPHGRIREQTTIAICLPLRGCAGLAFQSPHESILWHRAPSVLLAILILLAGRPPNLLVLAHKFVYGGAPGCDHRIQFFRGDAHRLHFGLPVSFLGRYETT